MAKYPLSFTAQARASGEGVNGTWSSQSAGHEFNLAIPTEFDGPGGGISPEELYAMALLNCFIATFKVIAQLSKLEYQAVGGEISIVVEPGEDRVIRVPRAHIKAWLQGASTPERASLLLEKASKSCLIINSVNTVKTFEFELR